MHSCVDSILNQTYKNIELILVDDGSTDKTPAILEKIRMSDDRVRVHRKINGGVGSSRNAALEFVTGQYVLFVDHDDWLEANHIETLYQKLVDTQSDIAIANFTEYHEAESVFKSFNGSPYYERIMTPAEWFKEQYNGIDSLSQCFTVPWGKLYKAELFENIVYPIHEKVEDDLTTWKIYLKANRLVYINQSLYIHRKLASSVTKTVNLSAVFPLKSIEERVVMLSLLGMDISNELAAYKWRLQVHKDALLEAGDMHAYRNVVQKLELLDKYNR